MSLRLLTFVLFLLVGFLQRRLDPLLVGLELCQHHGHDLCPLPKPLSEPWVQPWPYSFLCLFLSGLRQKLYSPGFLTDISLWVCQVWRICFHPPLQPCRQQRKESLMTGIYDLKSLVAGQMQLGGMDILVGLLNSGKVNFTKFHVQLPTWSIYMVIFTKFHVFVFWQNREFHAKYLMDWCQIREIHVLLLASPVIVS